MDLHIVSTNPYVQAILQANGIHSAEEYYEFDPPTPTPLKNLYNVKKAAQVIKKAAKQKQKILIYGDYDADGVLSSYVLFYTLTQRLGYANVEVYLPNRFKEGYGLTKAAVKKVLEKKPGLLILTDTGISFGEEVKLLRSKGIRVVIVDHHTAPSTLPEADALAYPLHPRSQITHPHMSATLVAYRLAEQLNNLTPITQLLDLVALSLITDIIPLKGDARYYLKAGLKKLATNPHPKLKNLIQTQDYQNIDTFLLGNIIGPKFNAPGRIQSAFTAFEYLTSQDPQQTQTLTQQLLDLNSQRQNLTQEYLNTPAAQQIELSKLVILVFEDAPEGIIGLIASSISQSKQKPTLVITKTQEGTYKGSGRAPANFNLIKFLREYEQFFLNLGGHKQAAGFSISEDQLKALLHTLQQNPPDFANYATTAQEPVIKVSNTSQLLQLMQALEFLAPFGEGFLMPQVELVTELTGVTNRKGHNFLTTSTPNIKIVQWSSTTLPPYGKVKLRGKPRLSLFNGNIELLFSVKQILPVD